MEPSQLHPFVREGLDILFVGLNPAGGSSRRGHYFSVNQAFWNQLAAAGLITAGRVDKSTADEVVFGSVRVNAHGWQYGITDLVTEIAESDSSLIKPGEHECQRLVELIRANRPAAVVLLHGKAVELMLKYLGQAPVHANAGRLGMILPGCESMFFSVAFPHGNAIRAEEKVEQYIKVREYLEGRG